MKKVILFVIVLLQLITAVAQRSKESYLQEFNSYSRFFLKYRNEGKTDSVLYAAKQCLRVAQAAQNDSLLTGAYSWLGNSFSLASDFAPALDYYFKALTLAEKRKAYIGAAGISSNISFSYYEVGNYQSGVDYGMKALRLLLSSHPSQNADVSLLDRYYTSLSGAYDNTGVSYIGLNQPDSALYYLQLGYAAGLKTKNEQDIYFKAALLTDLARTYELLKENKLAEDYYRQAIELSDSFQIPRLLAYSIKYYGVYLLRNNRVTDVINYCRKGVTAAIESKNRISVIDIAGLLQSAYEATNRNDSAFYFSKMVNKYRDSVFSTQKMLAIQNTVLKRQLDEKEHLEQLAKLEEERKHNLQYAAIALVLVSLLIFFFILSHSIIANQRLIKFLGILALLIVFEFLNLLLHPYIGNLTHESPALMLGVMVCLAALLIPLHHKLEHWITHKLVEKNNKIRLAAARKTIQQLEEKANTITIEKSTGR